MESPSSSDFADEHTLEESQPGPGFRWEITIMNISDLEDDQPHVISDGWEPFAVFHTTGQIHAPKLVLRRRFNE
jgi:hypothetical protein